MALSLGDRLGPYEILAPLGAGGMGEVYRARDARLGRDVAIKILPGDVAKDPERVARFEQEARALAALSHPNILAVHDSPRSPKPAARRLSPVVNARVSPYRGLLYYGLRLRRA